MVSPEVVSLSSEERNLLRSHLESLEEITPFAANPLLASKISALGLQQEVGTRNDEMAGFIFNAQTANPVLRESLFAEFITWKNLFGLRIRSRETDRLELRAQGLYDLIHPSFSYNEDGTVHSLVIFPEIVNAIAHSQGGELALVKTWGMNTIFGGFDPNKNYYQTQAWEIESNDVLKFSGLVRQGRIAFMGTHDLTAHIAGMQRQHWPELQKNAERVYQTLTKYFASVQTPSVSALILPYILGLVLDDLAQPLSYDSASHLVVLNKLLERIEKKEVPANLTTWLMKFPDSFEKISELSRKSGAEKTPELIDAALDRLIQEINSASFKTTG